MVLWEIGFEKRSFPSLNEDIAADVIVIGAGITGLSAAYLLQKKGKK
ncbi:MAG: FAD-binding oxidoreductase [Bacteroidales bacterium]|nr:FAD-binding oxidoreductase [Bacteroidales bacterium]